MRDPKLASIRQAISLFCVALLAVAAGCSGKPSPQTAAAESPGPRLYILDCGTISPMDPALFSLKKEVVKGDVTFVAMSHYHADHTANANAFAKSTWIVQQAEYDMMFKDGDVNIRSPETYKDLKDARRITLANADHDVFGDGTVIIKTAPGHTPGHQMLFLKLQHFGPLLLAGDLWHLPEERALDRVPTFDFDAAMTRATRVRVEQFLKDSGAQMWIQHDPPTYAALKKAPEYYD